MKHRRTRLSFTVLSTLLFFAFALQPTPSDPAITDPHTPSGARPVAIQELAEWVAGAPAAESERHVLRLQDLAALTGPARAPRRFSLFPPEASPEAKRRLLRGVPFGSAMARAAERHRVDALLVAAIVETESAFVADRISSRGAVGLMQILPSTGEEYGAQDLLDPFVNLEVGSRYLGDLIDEFGGDLQRAVAAYNAGPAAVERYRGVPPFAETRGYVSRVLTLYGEHLAKARGAEMSWAAR